MASLDVLDYQAGLEQALGERGPDGRPLLEAPLRRQAVRDMRRLLEAMAFRFAILDERPLPEDLDYLRALEAVHPPARAAPVLARRRPLYAATRRRRLATTWTVLGIVAVLVGGLAFLATSEASVPLASINEVARAPVTFSPNASFEVTDNMTRLHVDGTVIVHKDSPGVIEVRLLDPDGDAVLAETFAARGNLYLRHNVLDPEPGRWTLLVDFLDVQGSARVEVDGVVPTR